MKTWKKQILWMISAVFICLIVIGNGSRTYAEEIIVPAYTGETGNVEASTYQYQLTADKGILTVPVQISNAGLAVFEVTPKTSAAALHVVLSSQANAKAGDGWISIGTAVDGSTEKLIGYAKEPCTWYLHFFTAKNDDKEASITVKASQRAMVEGGGTLKKGTWSDYYIEADTTAYYKIKAPASGLMKLEVTAEEESPLLEAVLLNGKKKPLSSESPAYISKPLYFGVKKGTCYIRLYNDGMEGAAVRIRYTFENVKTTKNISKSKAISLKKGKTAKGLLLCGDKKTERWYKVTVPKNRKVKISLSAKSNDNDFSLWIYQANMKNVKSLELNNGKTKKTLSLKKGTYYFVISGYDTGMYSIQWK